MSTVEQQYAPAWRPFPGDVVRGKIVRIDYRSNHHGDYPIATLEVKPGEQIAIHGFGKILREEIAAREVGDVVQITYHGKVKGGGDFSYHKYVVETQDVETAGAAF